MPNQGHLPTEFFADDVYTITPQKQSAKTDDEWLTHEPEGQLSLDVFETPESVIIISPIAGAKPENLEIFVSNDLVTIRGAREDCSDRTDRNYLFQECFWGKFSRSIILPVHIKSDESEAVIKNGVLTITLPKQKGSMYVPVTEEFDEGF